MSVKKNDKSSAKSFTIYINDNNNNWEKVGDFVKNLDDEYDSFNIEKETRYVKIEFRDNYESKKINHFWLNAWDLRFQT